MTTSEFKEYYTKEPRAAMTFLRYHQEVADSIFAELGLSTTEYSIQEAVYLLVNPDQTPLCPVCKTAKRKFRKASKGYAATCMAPACSGAHRAAINTESSKKIDWAASISKRTETCLVKYGAESNLSSGTQSRQHAIESLIEKHGVASPLKSPLLRDKRNETTLARHGTLNFVRGERARATMIERYGTTEAMHVPDIVDRVSTTQSANKLNALASKCAKHQIEIVSVAGQYLDLKCRVCNEVHTNVLMQTLSIALRQDRSPCPVCNPVNRYRSRGENELAEWIKSQYAGEVHINRKYLGCEVDILIPGLKLGIEYNGVYWHSELRKHKQYHREKKAKVEESGYDLVQVWEDQWQDPLKQEIIKSKLMHRMGMTRVKLGARHCRLVEVTPAAAKKFMDENHLYGSTPSSIRLGLEWNGVLVMLCTFGRPRKTIAGKTSVPYELLRMATLREHSISGGFMRLIKWFKQMYPGELMTYADADWASSRRNGYDATGFSLVKWTGPGYWWVVDGYRYNRMSFMRSKISDIEEGETVDDYMHTRGHVKAWNSGNFLYTLS